MPFIFEPIEVETSFFLVRFSETDDSDLVMAIGVDEGYNTEVTHGIGIRDDAIFSLEMDEQIEAINRLKNLNGVNKI